MTKDYLFGLEDYSKATWTQNFVASIAGAVASITVAAPLDTVKTRIQNANFESKVSGATVIKELVRNEGPTALFKGLTPKVITPHAPRRPLTDMYIRVIFRSWSLVPSLSSATLLPSRSFHGSPTTSDPSNTPAQRVLPIWFLLMLG